MGIYTHASPPCLLPSPSHCEAWMGASSPPSSPLAWIPPPHRHLSWGQAVPQAWLHLLFSIQPLERFCHPPTLRQWCYLLRLQWCIHHLLTQHPRFQPPSHLRLLLIFLPFNVQAFYLIMIILLANLASLFRQHLTVTRVLKCLLEQRRAMLSAKPPFSSFRQSNSKCRSSCKATPIRSCSLQPRVQSGKLLSWPEKNAPRSA